MMPLITYVNVLQQKRHVVLEKLVIRGITHANVEQPVLAQETHKEHIAIQAITPASVPRRLHYVRHLRLVMEVLASVVQLVHVQEMLRELIATPVIMFVNAHRLLLHAHLRRLVIAVMEFASAGRLVLVLEMLREHIAILLIMFVNVHLP